MKLTKVENFRKIKIEDVKFYHNSEGKPIITEWTGYGLLTVPYHKHIAINRGTRKPVFTMSYGRRLFYIDIREYLKEYLEKRAREEREILNQEEEERYNKETGGDQLKIKFGHFCQYRYGKPSSKKFRSE